MYLQYVPMQPCVYRCYLRKATPMYVWKEHFYIHWSPSNPGLLPSYFRILHVCVLCDVYVITMDGVNTQTPSSIVKLLITSKTPHTCMLYMLVVQATDKHSSGFISGGPLGIDMPPLENWLVIYIYMYMPPSLFGCVGLLNYQVI